MTISDMRYIRELIRYDINHMQNTTKSFIKKEKLLTKVTENIATLECINTAKKQNKKKTNPYRCPACGHGLAYVNAPCVNEKCVNYMDGIQGVGHP